MKRILKQFSVAMLVLGLFAVDGVVCGVVNPSSAYAAEETV